VIASSSCSVMAARSGDLFRDDTKDFQRRLTHPCPPIYSWAVSSYDQGAQTVIDHVTVWCNSVTAATAVRVVESGCATS
jgi:hypothetical protein